MAARDSALESEHRADHRQARERQRGNGQLPPPRSPIGGLAGVLGVDGTRGVELVILSSRAIGLRRRRNEVFRFVDCWSQRGGFYRPGDSALLLSGSETRRADVSLDDPT